MFAAGLLLGWLGALAWQDDVPNRPPARHAQSRPETGADRRVSSAERADSIGTAARRTDSAKAALSPLHATRIAQALSQPVVDSPPEAPAASTADQRFVRWLEQSGLSADLRTQIGAAYAKEQTAGIGGDPLRAGSRFDEWLRERLDADSATAWGVLLDEHRGDVVERRANHLLAGLQDAVALSNDQKDVIYPKLAAWASDELEQPITEGQSEPGAREDWLTRRYDELCAMLPADQHGAIAAWLTEFLPGYWLAGETAR